MFSRQLLKKWTRKNHFHRADGSFWNYQYDQLGQVVSGKRFWSDGTPVAGQQFEYGFDDIGNRTTTKAGGDSTGANLRSATYTANNLNQYSSRTVPAGFDVIGLANTAASVARFQIRIFSDSCPMRSMRPIRCSIWAGFQGRS